MNGSEDEISGGVKIHSDQEESRPLVPDYGNCRKDEEYVYDENGSLTRTLPISPDGSQSPIDSRPCESERRNPKIKPPLGFRPRSCSLATLDGSWYLQLTPDVETASRPAKIHGAMRIEARNREYLRISADIYTEEYKSKGGRPQKPIPENPLTIRRNWYPQFPKKKYSWYVRSQGIRFVPGSLSFKAERHIWDHRADDFSGTETGSVTLHCRQFSFKRPSLPQPTVRMKGTATFSGTKYNVVATKTSPYYRGCLIETDVMKNRQWTGTAQATGGGNLDFSGVYRDAGLEFRSVIDEIDIPEDADLTLTELHQMLASHRSISSLGPHSWRLWLVIGSQLGNSGTLGIMFDDINPFREGTAAFYDPRFSNSNIIDPLAQGQRIGDVPLAILRTALHEVGHAFNLFHPKHDVHSVSIGTSIMNQTGDVMGFASQSNPYPNNATFAFNEHNRTSLIHSPDPQIRPGWKQFGYSHGGSGNAPGEPSDLTFDRDTPTSNDVNLEVSLPRETYPGELVIADVYVENTGDETHNVTASLNLKEDYLSFFITSPNGDKTELRDVVLICCDRRTVDLDSGDRLTGHIQLLYTNREHVFDRPGRYTVEAELDLGDRVARSEPTDVLVRSPISEDELELSTQGLDRDVGRSIALGILPLDTPTAEENLTRLAEDFTETDIGTAAALVMSKVNSKDVYDYRAETTARAADDDNSEMYLDLALEGYDATSVMRIATAVIPSGEEDASILDNLLDRFDENEYDDDDIEGARMYLSDFRAGSIADAQVGPTEE